MRRSMRGPDYGLQVFEKHPAADAYRVGPGFTGYAILAVEKRFTDAELASEYWNLNYFGSGAQFNEISSGQDYSEDFWEQHYDRINTLYRFATSNHFDE